MDRPKLKKNTVTENTSKQWLKKCIKKQQVKKLSWKKQWVKTELRTVKKGDWKTAS